MTVDLVARARVLARAGEREGAGWALYRAATIADDATATDLLEDALRTVAELPCPRLRGSIALAAAELAYDAGDVPAGAAASVAAERQFQVAGDARGFLAVWTARALRALRTGDGDAGVLMVRWMLPWLDRVGEPAPRMWLRLYGAEHLLARGDVAGATRWLEEVLAVAPADAPERAVAADGLVRILAPRGRRADAVALALEALTGSTAATTERAALYHTLATAVADAPELAAACLAVAGALGSAPPRAGPRVRAVIDPLIG